MKATTSRRPSGFTLVELLVVIVIIAVLATLGITSGLKYLQEAKRTASMAVARGIEGAVNNFFTEYGSMPGDGTTTTDTTCTTKAGDSKGIELLEILLGTDTSVNTRGIKFLQVTDGSKNANGIIYNGETVTGLYDPWGGPYNVMLDFDIDEKLSAQAAADASAKILNGRRVAVWSNGADNTGLPGSSTPGKAKDDVKTW